MFDLEQFVADCRTALAADRSHKLVREVIARAVSDPQAVLNVLGEPRRAQIQTLLSRARSHHLERHLGTDDDDHAAQSSHVGGDRHLYRAGGQCLLAAPRTSSGRVEAAGAKALCVGDAEPLGHNIIHSVTNPIPRLTGRSTSMAGISSTSSAANGIRNRCSSSPTTPSAPCSGSRTPTQTSSALVEIVR